MAGEEEKIIRDHVKSKSLILMLQKEEGRTTWLSWHIFIRLDIVGLATGLYYLLL